MPNGMDETDESRILVRMIPQMLLQFACGNLERTSISLQDGSSHDFIKSKSIDRTINQKRAPEQIARVLSFIADVAFLETLLGEEVDEVCDSAAISPLVIIPCDNFTHIAQGDGIY